MADYTTTEVASAYIGQPLTGGDLALLGTLVTACSRAFDRETNRPANYWAPGTAVTRRYGGTGSAWLDIDEFASIAAVTMSATQNRAGAVTLPVVTNPDAPGYVPTGDDVIPYPLSGPPYTRLFLMRGFLPDAYNLGNVEVTGTQATPPEVADAVAVWVAYRWKRMKANWAQRVTIPNGPALQWADAPPPEVQRVIAYFTDRVGGHGPNVAAVAGGDDPRVSPWLGWRVVP
jgi:hypothetical protein